MNVCFVATNNDTELAFLGSHATIVHDPDQKLHRRYGAETECLYLIRPDGYVSYRSQPATMSNFGEYLARILKRVQIQLFVSPSPPIAFQ